MMVYPQLGAFTARTTSVVSDITTFALVTLVSLGMRTCLVYINKILTNLKYEYKTKNMYVLITK